MIQSTFYRKTVAFVALFSLMISSFSGVFAASVGSDIDGHWAEDVMNAWVAQGFMHGFHDATLKPNQDITRAEFMSFVNRAFGFTKKSTLSFRDLPADSNAWYVKEVEAAVAAGYIEGYEDGTIRPHAPITRQEAAAIVARVLKLDVEMDADVLAPFVDRSTFADWSLESIRAVVAKGYMHGTPNKHFLPFKNITRAEAVVTLDRALHDVYEVYGTAGEFGPATGTKTILGNVMVSVAGVTLRNMVITGDLLLGAGIGDGDVTLSGVTVRGKTTVQGGGENSIHVINSELFTVIVDRQNGTVRIVASGSTAIDHVTLQSGAKLEESNVTGTGFADVAVQITDNGQVVLTGDFQHVQIDVPDISVALTAGSVAELYISERAPQTSIDIHEGAKVAELTLNAATNVGGSGAIAKAIVNADGTKLAQKPLEVQLAPGTSTDVGGQKVTESSPPAQAAVPTAPITGDGSSGGSTGGGQTKKFTLTSSAFTNGGAIPLKHSAHGDNVSVPLSWSNVPSGTQSFVLVMYDREYKNMIHWLTVNIPKDTRTIAEGASAESMPEHSTEIILHPMYNGYYGPQPPISSDPEIGMEGTHRYEWILYALNEVLEIDDAALNPSEDGKDPDIYSPFTVAQLEEDLKNRILGKATLSGTYFAKAAPLLTLEEEDGEPIDLSKILYVEESLLEDENDPSVTEMVYVLNSPLNLGDLDELGLSLTVAVYPYGYYGAPHEGTKISTKDESVHRYEKYQFSNMDLFDESTWIVFKSEYLADDSKATLVMFFVDADDRIRYFYKVFIKELQIGVGAA